MLRRIHRYRGPAQQPPRKRATKTSDALQLNQGNSLQQYDEISKSYACIDIAKIGAPVLGKHGHQKLSCGSASVPYIKRWCSPTHRVVFPIAQRLQEEVLHPMKVMPSVRMVIEDTSPILQRNFVAVHSDQESLRWIINISYPNGRLMRWSLRPAEFHCQVIYQKGNPNTQFDKVSRPHHFGRDRNTDRKDIPCFITNEGDPPSEK